jgi:beta-lactamase class A
MRNGLRVWLIAGVAVLATVALVAGVIIGLRLGDRRTTSHPPVQWALAADFARLETQLHAVAGIAVSAVGNGQTPITLGQWQSGPAWSTIKVPLVIAALREEHPPILTDAMTAAITESDNAAAESIWASLSDPVTAARKVDAVLRQTGDPTTVQSQKMRPEFSVFGQTEWPLTDQVRFISIAVCDTANAPVFALMGRVESADGPPVGAARRPLRFLTAEALTTSRRVRCFRRYR